MSKKFMSLINNTFLESKAVIMTTFAKKCVNQNVYNKAIIVSQNSKIVKKGEILQNKVDQFSSFSLFEQKQTTSRLSLIKKVFIGSSVNFKKSFFINSKNDYFQFHQDRFFIDNSVELKNSGFFLDTPKDSSNIINYPTALVLKPRKGGFICYSFGFKGFYPRIQIKKSLNVLPKKHPSIFKSDYLIRLPFNHFITKLSINRRKKKKRKSKKFFFQKKRNKYILSHIYFFDKKKEEIEIERKDNFDAKIQLNPNKISKSRLRLFKKLEKRYQKFSTNDQAKKI